MQTKTLYKVILIQGFLLFTSYPKESTTPSFDTLTHKFKAVVCEEDKMQHRYLSKVLALLPLIAYQHFNFNAGNIFSWYSETNISPHVKKLLFDSLIETRSR